MPALNRQDKFARDRDNRIADQGNAARAFLLTSLRRQNTEQRSTEI
jgi:hypothetical protein